MLGVETNAYVKYSITYLILWIYCRNPKCLSHVQLILNKPNPNPWYWSYHWTLLALSSVTISGSMYSFLLSKWAYCISPTYFSIYYLTMIWTHFLHGAGQLQNGWDHILCSRVHVWVSTGIILEMGQNQLKHIYLALLVLYFKVF